LWEEIENRGYIPYIKIDPYDMNLAGFYCILLSKEEITIRKGFFRLIKNRLKPIIKIWKEV